MSLASDFKEALSSWATGVSVVAARAGGLEHGVTVSSFTSLSLDPPLVLVCLQTKSTLLPMVAEAGRFSVSVLAADQQGVSTHFASVGRAPGAHSAYLEGGDADGDNQAVPVVRGAAAWLRCALHERLSHGDHVIVMGRVVAAHAEAGRAPLLYHRRGYHDLGARR
jgi:3-hydroxy-9,10-secoandrosta-1,3,5(10)-triene-9,17-dione monooxygenase reductase component